MIIIRVLDFELDGVKVPEAYGVQVAPSLVLLDKTGEKIDNMRAPLRTALDLKEKLEKTMKGEGTLNWYEKKYAENQDDL